jgi:hypothetical protein
MAILSRIIRQLWQCAGMLCTLLLDAAWFLRLCLHSPAALAAENLFQGVGGRGPRYTAAA